MRCRDLVGKAPKSYVMHDNWDGIRYIIRRETSILYPHSINLLSWRISWSSVITKKPTQRRPLPASMVASCNCLLSGCQIPFSYCWMVFQNLFGNLQSSIQLTLVGRSNQGGWDALVHTRTIIHGGHYKCVQLFSQKTWREDTKWEN